MYHFISQNIVKCPFKSLEKPKLFRNGHKEKEHFICMELKEIVQMDPTAKIKDVYLKLFRILCTFFPPNRVTPQQMKLGSMSYLLALFEC